MSFKFLDNISFSSDHLMRDLLLSDEFNSTQSNIYIYIYAVENVMRKILKTEVRKRY